MITAKDALAADLAKQSPATMKSASIADLRAVAQTVRTFLIGSRTPTDYRLGVNLSYVELTMALHRAFDWPDDRIIFDGGHQMDAHRVLTGRVDRFNTPSYDPSGRVVLKAEGSPDVIEAVRAGTSISIALGMALARALKGDTRPVVAVVGDGALAQGVALEALSHAAGVPHVNLIVVLNDNGAAAASAGGLQSYLQTLAPDRRGPEPFFTALGLDYVGPVDGHRLEAVAEALERAKTSTQIPLVHVKTQRWHGTRPPVAKPRDPSSTPRYVDVAAKVVSDEMARDERIVVVVPAPVGDSGFALLLTKFPDRGFAPRLDEAHALAMTVGLAAERYKPVVVAEAAFLERGFDQLMRDICAGSVPAVVVAVGLPAGTKAWHGVTNLRVLAPTGRAEYERVLRDTLRDAPGPTLIVTPAGAAS